MSEPHESLYANPEVLCLSWVKSVPQLLNVLDKQHLKAFSLNRINTQRPQTVLNRALLRATNMKLRVEWVLSARLS